MYLQHDYITSMPVGKPPVFKRKPIADIVGREVARSARCLPPVGVLAGTYNYFLTNSSGVNIVYFHQHANK